MRITEQVRITKRRIGAVICVAAIIFLMAYIWHFSIESISDSDARSKAVLEIIKPFLEFFIGKGKVTNHLIRKLAHFTEFFMLGAAVGAFIDFIQRRRPKAIIIGLLFGVIVASLDETIQLFTNRGSQISDVILDSSGYAVGFLVLILLGWCVAKLRAGMK